MPIGTGVSRVAVGQTRAVPLDDVAHVKRAEGTLGGRTQSDGAISKGGLGIFCCKPTVLLGASSHKARTRRGSCRRLSKDQTAFINKHCGIELNIDQINFIDDQVTEEGTKEQEPHNNMCLGQYNEVVV